MLGMLSLDRLAAARGDGLRPELRALLERRAAIETGPAVVALDAGQAGPNPPAARTLTLGDNVVPFAAKPLPDDEIRRKSKRLRAT